MFLRQTNSPARRGRQPDGVTRVVIPFERGSTEALSWAVNVELSGRRWTVAVSRVLKMGGPGLLAGAVFFCQPSPNNFQGCINKFRGQGAEPFGWASARRCHPRLSQGDSEYGPSPLNASSSLSARYSFRQNAKNAHQLTKADFLRCGSERLRWASNCLSSPSPLSNASIWASFLSIWVFSSSSSSLPAGGSGESTRVDLLPLVSTLITQWPPNLLPVSNPLVKRLRTVFTLTFRYSAVSTMLMFMLTRVLTLLRAWVSGYSASNQQFGGVWSW